MLILPPLQRAQAEAHYVAFVQALEFSLHELQEACVVAGEYRCWQVLRDGYLIDEQETPLGQIIGRDDDTVPTMQVGNAWYLTESYE